MSPTSASDASRTLTTSTSTTTGVTARPSAPTASAYQYERKSRIAKGSRGSWPSRSFSTGTGWHAPLRAAERFRRRSPGWSVRFRGCSTCARRALQIPRRRRRGRQALRPLTIVDADDQRTRRSGRYMGAAEQARRRSEVRGAPGRGALEEAREARRARGPGAPDEARRARRPTWRGGDVARPSRRAVALTAVTVVLGLALIGCTGSTDPPPPEPGPTTLPATAPQAVTETQPAPSNIAEANPDAAYVPPGMDWLPPDEELDRLVAQAEHAYRAHWARYDAAIRAGFGDPELTEALLASAGGATLEALYLQVAAIGDTGRFVEGGSAVLGTAHAGLDPPAAAAARPGLLLDTCLPTPATLKQRDGTTVRELSGPEPRFLRVRLVQRSGTWLVTSQTQHGSPCPELLLASGGA